MQAISTDREYVMQVLRTAVAEFDAGTSTAARPAGTPRGAGTPRAAVVGATEMNPVEAARMGAQLRQALYWMENVEPVLAEEGEVEDLEPGARYISQHPVVALVQTAIDEGTMSAPVPRGTARDAASGAAEAAPKARGVDVLGAISGSLQSLFRGKAKFIAHKSLQDFRFDLEERCTVALVGDWGTGFDGAVDVIQQIAKHRPQHLIHLGDIYMSGTGQEVQEKFINILDRHGPTECRFWALNGNHEMNSGGEAYFERVLPFCGQPASYFALGNRHWRLVGLDTAHEGYRLRAPQLEWVAPLLIEPGPKNILLTHHQVFSVLDGRPAKHDTDIFLGPLAEPGDVHAWFWGHEHNCVIYEPDPRRGGMLARCIGHGGKDQKVPEPKKPKRGVPAIHKLWTLRRSDDPGFARNGFVLLEIDGPRMDVSYIAADGEVFFRETWRADE